MEPESQRIGGGGVGCHSACPKYLLPVGVALTLATCLVEEPQLPPEDRDREPVIREKTGYPFLSSIPKRRVQPSLGVAHLSVDKVTGAEES